MAGDEPSFGSQLRGEIQRKVDEAGLSQTDYVKAALKWQYNWIGLAGAAAFALVSGTGLPLVLAAGLELMYMSLVPQSSRFRRLVRSWKFAAEKREKEKALSTLFNELPLPMQSRYSNLAHVVGEIRSNYSKLSSMSQVFAKQMEDKFNGLADGYLRLLHAAHIQREYLAATNPALIEKEIEHLEQMLAQDSPKVQEINRKRIEINRKRLAKYEKIRDNRDVVDAQCAAIEDVLKLIRDQSVTMRDPQQVSEQLDHLVEDMEQTEQTVREMESLFEMASPDAHEPVMLPPAPDAPATTPRTRLRN